MTLPADHPYRTFLREIGDAPSGRRAWTEADGALPSLYLGHGAPPLLDSRRWLDELHGWASTLPVPRAVLMISAHWEAAPIAVSQSAPGTPLVYDFGGFAPHYYTLQYDTPDATWLADRVDGVLPEPVHRHPTRGLDHGAWVPLMAMYPDADVPVLQLSLPTHDPERLLAIGGRLRDLREEGVLVIGSGFLTHGLPYLTRDQFLGRAAEPAWSRDFDAWAADALGRGDVEELARFERAPGMPYAHPTVEHYTPLFVTLGAAAEADRPVTTTIEGYFFGLSKRSFQAA